VNSITRLFMDPSWEMIRNLPANDLMELIVLGLMSVGLLAAALYGIYLGLFRRNRGEHD